MAGASTILLLVVSIFFRPAVSRGSMSSSPGCPDKCGDVSIPYPYGIGEHCAATSLNRYFNLTCDDTTHPPKPTIVDANSTVEVTDISLERGEIRVLSPVYHICFASNTTFTEFVDGYYDLEGTPFLPSPSRNRFTVIGCNTLGLLRGYKGTTNRFLNGCYSYCERVNNTSDGAPCTGMGCCEAAIPANLTALWVMFGMNQSQVWSFNPCFYAMVHEVGWYSFRQRDLVGHLGFINDRGPTAPTIVDWAIRNTSCPDKGKDTPAGYACTSTNSYCMPVSNGPGYLCQCSGGYVGNPYLPNGCQDRDECALRRQDPKYEDLYPCRNGVCHNTPGSYECTCKAGRRKDSTGYACLPRHNSVDKLVIGLSVSVTVAVVMALTCLSLMQLQRKRHNTEKDEYFKQNGGLKLYDEMRSRRVDTIRILTEKDINRATDNYSEDRILGCGGHGMVYRGTLYDHKEVAIKKSKVINNDCREEFVNEIIILSQINHRNIVRLLGCCLDVDIPMLVYEFVSNGTLYEFLHSADHRLPIPLDLRLKIATQSAEALAYLHSSTSRTILHGDVKSANILLDDQHNAKVADFGASTLKSMDESEFIIFVQGTLGYLDPECFISHCITDKSDVYSFGVVLLELMTRKRALYANNFNKKEALSYTFPLMFQQKMHRIMLDIEIIDEAVTVVLEKLAQLAVECLCPRGDDRPTMKEVAERLQVLWRLQMHATSGHEDKLYAHNYGGPSLVADPLDSTTYNTM